MTTNDIATKYTLSELSKMFSGAVEEMQRLDNLLKITVLNEGFKTTCLMYKKSLAEFAQMVFDAMKIKEKPNK